MVKKLSGVWLGLNHTPTIHTIHLLVCGFTYISVSLTFYASENSLVLTVRQFFFVVYRRILKLCVRSTVVEISVFVFDILDLVYGVYGWCMVEPQPYTTLLIVFQ